MKILMLLMLLLPTTIIGQRVQEPKMPKEKAEALLASLQKGDITGGYDRLFIDSCPGLNQSQSVLLLKKQTETGLSLYGKVLTHEFVKEEAFGSSLVRLVYLLKSENYFTVWEFYFYKPKETWLLASVNFNDQFSSLK